MPKEIELAADHWNRRVVEDPIGAYAGYWLANAEMHRYVNRMSTGSENTDWLCYALQRYFDGKLPLDRCLSLACGEGRLERHLAQLVAFRCCDAFDVSEESIKLAASKAESAGISGIHYVVADVNKLKLDESVYDAIFIDGGAHHFTNLEHVFQELALALKPGGFLVLNEYIGPNRFQFPVRQKEIASLCLRLIPRKYRLLPVIIPVVSADGASPSHTNTHSGLIWILSRLIDKIRDKALKEVIARRWRKIISLNRGPGATKDEISFPSPRDVSSVDPSEAVRSADIVPVLNRFFDIVERRNWGGSILQFLLSDIAGNFKDEDPESIAILQILTNIEEKLILSGELQSDFAFIVARPCETLEY